MPLVTVIVPMHNDQRTIAEALRSVLAQTLSDWQLVVVDDGSTDDSAAIAADFAWRDPRIRVLRQVNQGAAAARNRGLREAAGRYIHFLDADDWLLPRALAALVEAAEWSGLGAACGSWTVHSGDGRALGVRMPVPGSIVGPEHFREGNRIAPHSQIIRKTLLPAAPFDPSERFVRDYDLWLRLAASGVRWSGIDETVAAYRVRRGSLSKNPGMMARTALGVLERHAGATESARRSIALFYATNAALDDDDPTQGAAHAMLRENLGGPGVWTADELGRGAWWSLVFGHGLGPDDLGPAAGAWLPRARAWWTVLGMEDRLGEALSALLQEAVQPDAVATRLLDTIPIGKRIIDVVGAMGKNGRVIQRLARERGIAVRPRDDRLPGAAIEGPYEPGTLVVVAPLADQAMLPRLPVGVRVMRWADARRSLATQLQARMPVEGAARKAIGA
ncbi:MAG TPA: glycosyltransferase family 2 protein [Phycisphaerales bacterium]|nr:glycosyltransferase family 2 protein [Phycisphaerales bacterium]